MAIKYCGNEIIHEYKGRQIKRVVRHYFGSKETHYVFDGKIFLRLKDAKHYIDTKENI